MRFVQGSRVDQSIQWFQMTIAARKRFPTWERWRRPVRNREPDGLAELVQDVIHDLLTRLIRM